MTADLVARLEEMARWRESDARMAATKGGYEARRNEAALLREAASALRSSGEAVDYTPGALDQSAPARIWLQIDTAGDNSERDEAFPRDNWEHVSWCQESIGGLEIQYVRADLASPATPATVTDEDVERAAIALAMSNRPHPNPPAYWAWLHEDEREKYRRHARAALESFVRKQPAASAALERV